jgi:hypothetical protein
MKHVPEVLDKITDIVLAYRPKPKSKSARPTAPLDQIRDAVEAGI